MGFLEKICQDPQLDKSIIFFNHIKSDKDIAASYQLNLAGYFIKDQVGDGFLEIVKMLKGYWKIVLFPRSKTNQQYFYPDNHEKDKI